MTTEGALREALTETQVEDIHKIIERHSTDVIDYELATDDINAYLSLSSPIERSASCPCGSTEHTPESHLAQASSEVRERLAAIPNDVDTLLSRMIYGETVEDVRRKVAGYLERALAPSRQGAGSSTKS